MPFFDVQESEEAINTQVPVFDEEDLRYQTLRNKKLVFNKKGTHPYPFYLPSECLVQESTEEGAARGQSENYIVHITQKQCKHPNAKNQSAMEGSLKFEIQKPWTHSLIAFKGKLLEDPEFLDFFVDVWAHQHLLESRKRTATYFVGNDLLALSFSTHLVHIWIDLTYEEESELSSVHNLVAHDINSESVSDKIYKLRLSWTHLGCFDWENLRGTEVMDLKLRAFRCIGIKTKQDLNSNSWMLRLACTPQPFFDKLIAVSEAHRECKLKGMKVAGGNQSTSKKPRPAPDVSLNKKYSSSEEGPEIKTLFFKELSWIKLDKDFEAMTQYLEALRAGVTTYEEFMSNLADYKDYKFLRIQLRVKV